MLKCIYKIRKKSGLDFTEQERHIETTTKKVLLIISLFTLLKVLNFKV